MANSSEPAFLFLYRKGAIAPVDYLSTFATAPFILFTYFSEPKTDDAYKANQHKQTKNLFLHFLTPSKYNKLQRIQCPGMEPLDTQTTPAF